MIPIKLIMENFISHMHSEIDFTQFNAALIIGASDGNVKVANGVGKTSIFDSIRFALYGKTRFSKKEKVIKYGKASCKVTFIFYMDDVLYKVERSMNRKTTLINVGFYKMENDEWVHEGFTCDTPTATTSKIESIVGMSHDTFVNCIYFRQNDISGFAGARPNKRKEVLKEILQIGFWDKLQEIAKEHEKSLISQRDLIIDRLDLLGNIEKQEEEAKEKLKDTKENLEKYKLKAIELEKAIENNNEKIGKLEIILSKKDDKPNKLELEGKLQEISSRLEEVKETRDAIKREVQKNNEMVANAHNDMYYLEKKLLDLAKDILMVEHKGRKKAETIFRLSCKEAVPAPLFTINDLTLKKRERDKHHRSVDLLKAQLTQLTSLQPGKRCPICLSEIENIVDVIQRREAKAKFLQNQITELEQRVAEIENLIQKEENLLDKANVAVVEVERLELMISKRNAESTNSQEKNDNLREKFNVLADEWKRLKAEKIRIASFIDALTNTDSCQSELNTAQKKKESLSQKLTAIRENIMSSSIQVGHFEANLEEIERKISEKQTLLTRKNQLTDEIEIYAEVSKAFGRDGIQAIIMENVTEDLKNYTNSILKDICSELMSVNFVTQRQTGLGTWKEDFNISIMVGNNEMDFDDLSGGEQVRVSIAVRLALSRLLMQRIGSNVKFLLLDEVDQALDSQGVEALSDAILALSKEFKIMLITHNEAMKEKFEHVITVLKGSVGSVIR